MAVRAKFKVFSKTVDGEVVLRPVISGSAENESFFRWTPCGEIRMSVLNQQAFDALTLGEEFYVDFTPAK